MARHIIVSGGRSGIGLATARHLAGQGNRVRILSQHHETVCAALDVTPELAGGCAGTVDRGLSASYGRQRRWFIPPGDCHGSPDVSWLGGRRQCLDQRLTSRTGICRLQRLQGRRSVSVPDDGAGAGIEWDHSHRHQIGDVVALGGPTRDSALELSAALRLRGPSCRRTGAFRGMSDQPDGISPQAVALI